MDSKSGAVVLLASATGYAPTCRHALLMMSSVYADLGIRHDTDNDSPVSGHLVLPQMGTEIPLLEPFGGLPSAKRQRK
jgi:hypothetical protein